MITVVRINHFSSQLYAGAPSQAIRESTIMQAITGLNETISLVLDFLQDAKVHILLNWT
jgi:hypothetical protein